VTGSAGYLTEADPAAAPPRTPAAEHPQPARCYPVPDPDAALDWYWGPKGLHRPVAYLTEADPP
jgi:hypothetical protein